MATEADIPEPICETRMEQHLHIVDQATSISNNKLPQEENEPLTVEGDDFLTPPSTDQVHCEVNKTSLDATEKPDHTEKDETVILLHRSPKLDDQPLQVIAANAEDSSERVQQNTEKSNVSDTDEDRGVAQSELSKEITHGETTEDDITGNLTSDESKEVEYEHNKITTEGVGLSNERNFADSSEIVGEKPSQENSTSVETITSSTSGDEVQGKNTLNSSLCEEDISITKGDRIVITPEDSETLSTITAQESHDIITSQENPEVTETEERPLVEVDGTQTGHDEQFEKENEELSPKKVSTGGTEDDESTVIDKVIDDDEEDLRKAVPSETEENISTLLKEDVDAEKSVESLHVIPEIIKASNLSEENKTESSPEEHSKNANQQGIDSDDTEEKTIDAVEEKKEVLESFSTIVSSSSKEERTTAESKCTDENTVDKVDTHKEILEEFSAVVPNEEIEENSNKVDGSETKDEESLANKCQLEKESEANDNESMVDKAGVEDRELRKTELCENEISTESILSKIEPNIEKPEDSLNVVSEDIDHEIETRSFIEEHIEAAQPQADLDGKADDKTLDTAETKEEILEVQNVPTSVPDSNDDPKTTVDEVKIEVEHPSREELFEEEKNIEHDLGQHTETAASDEEESLTESSEEISGNKTEEVATNTGDSNEKTQELQNVATNVSNEDDDKNSSIQVDASQMKHDRDLEKEIETPSLGEASPKDAPEENETSASNEDTEITCTLEEQSLTAITSDKAIDSTGTKAVYLENVATEVPQEHTEENSVINVDFPQMESGEHLEKETENSSLTEALMEETNDNESKILNETNDNEFKNEEPLEKDGEEASLITDSIENSNDDLITTLDEVKIDAKYPSREELLEEEKNYEHDLGQHTETTASFKEQSLTESPEEISGDKTEEIAINASDPNEKTQELQNVAINFSNEDDDKNSLIQVDASQMKHDRDFEKEIETPSLEEASTKDAPEENKESTLLKEVSQDAFKDHETSASNEDTETTSTLEEQSLTAIPQTIASDKAIDSIGTKADYIENVATEVPHEQMESKEHLEKETEISSLTEAPTEDTNDDESKSLNDYEPKDREAELLENETKSPITSPIEEARVEKPNDSREAASEYIMGSDLCQEISSDKAEGKTIDAAEMKEETPQGGFYAYMHNKWMDFTGNNNDEESTIIQEAKLVDQNLKAELIENEKSTESNLVDDEVSIRSLEVSDEDTKASASGQDREAGSLEEQGLTTNSSGVIDDQKEDETETPEDKDVATTTLHEDTEKNTPIQVSCHIEQNQKHLEKESENTSPTGETIESSLKNDAVVEKAIDSLEAVKEDTEASEQIQTADPQEISCDKTEEKTIDEQKDEKSVDATKTPEDKEVATTTLHEDTDKNIPIQVSCQTEQNEHLEKESENTSPTGDTIESTLKDDIVVEKAIDSLEVVKEDIEAFEQIPTANPQEISCDKAEEKTIDDQKEDKSVEAFEQIPTADPQEISCNKAEEKTIDDQKEDKSVEAFEQIPTADPQEISCNIAEEKTIDDQKEDKSVEAFEQIPTADPQEISCDRAEEKTIDDQKEGKSVDATETPEDKILMQKVATTLHEDTEENTLAQLDCQMEQKEHLEKESENTSPTGETEERTLKDDAVVEKAIESFEVVKEDIEASEQIPDKSEDKTIDPIYTEEQTLEVQDIEHNEYNSPIGEDGSQNSSSEAASRENANEDDSSISYDAKFVDESSTKADLYESDKSVEGTLLKEEAPAEDIREPASGQDTSDLKEEAPEHEARIIMNISPAIPYEESEDMSLIQVHSSHMEQNEHSENESESSSLTEAPTRDTTESALLKEEHTEKPIDMCQEANEDIKEYPTIQETETSSINEEIITADAQKALGEKIEEETIDATHKEETLDVQDPEAITGEKYIQEELPTNVSRDVTESNGVNGEEETNSNDCEVISDSSNAVTSEEDLTTNSFEENKREIHHEAETEEAQKQDDDLHVSALGQDSSMEEMEKDAQLSLASADDSDVIEEVQKLEEPSLSAPDNITEKTEGKDSEVPEDATEKKYIEHLEQENTTISLDVKNPTAIEQGETECEQVLLDETVEEINESVSITVANDFPPTSFTETSEVDHFTSERELSIDREELQTGNTTTGDDEEAKNDRDNIKEEKASEQKIPEENLTCKFMKEADTFLEPTDTTESTVINKSSITDIETKVDNEAPETIETAPSATEGQEVESTSVQETPALASQFEKSEHEYEFIGNVKVLAEKSEPNVVRVAPEENKSKYESQNQGLESIAQVQSCDIIPKATKMEIEEEDIETAAEIKSYDVPAEDIYEPKGTPYENESMKVNISSEKFKEEDEHLEDYHGSRKEEVITERCLNDEVAQEEINAEEIFEVKNNGKETEKVSDVSEEIDDKAVEEPETNSRANESLENQEELVKSDEEITTILDTEEVERSTIAVLENVNNRTGAAEVKMAQEDGPLNLQNVREIGEDVKELNEGCVEVSNKENLVEVDPIENIEAKVSSEKQEAEKNQKAVVSETLNQEIEEQQRGITSEVVLKAEEENCEEDNIKDNKCDDLVEKENSSSGAAEKVSEFNIHQSSVEDIAQSDKKEETEKSDSLTILPHVKCSDIETTESVEKSESKEMDNRSLLDLLQSSKKKTPEVACHSAIGEDTTIHKEETQPEKTDEAEHEDAKTDEEKDDEDESSEQRRSELGCEAPVMVDMGDADMKSAHKKSHNILSGVGSKMKHSIAKVKKAITGKSSHPKPPSPK